MAFKTNSENTNIIYFLFKILQLQKWIIGAVVVALSVLIIYPEFRLNYIPEQGTYYPHDIKTGKTLEYDDYEATGAKRRQAEERTLPVFDFYNDKFSDFENKLKDMTSEVRKIISSGMTQEEKLKEVENILDSRMNPNLLDDFDTLAGIMDEALIILGKRQEYYLVGNARVNYRRGINIRKIEDDQVAKELVETDTNRILSERRFKEFLSERLKRDISDSPSENIPLAASMISETFRPLTLKFNEKITRNLKETAKENIKTAKSKIRKGNFIVEGGEKVTGELVNRLKVYDDTFLVRKIAILAFVLSLIVALVGLYMRLYLRSIFNRPSRLILLGILIILTMIFMRITLKITTLWPAHIGYSILPLPAIAMFIAILIERRLSILISTLLVFFFGMFCGWETDAIVLLLTGSIAGAFSAGYVRTRTDLSKAGLYVGLANIIVALVTGYLFQKGPAEIAVVGFSGAINGIIISPIIVLGGLPFFETIFNITTNLKLLELGDLNSPTMKKMMMEAPGTYQHSLVVSNLSEMAAESIGANSLLARIGGYYHDVGKMDRAEYFLENINLIGDNKHSGLKPSLSSSIIKAHVKDGIETAEKNKLPSVITDLIRQHHGTSVISYFYHQSIENGDMENTNRSDFQYPGPKPQTKEAGILMLADSVEAAVRALPKPSPTRIEETVKKVINNKFSESELDECELTLKDLNRIAETFIRMLNSMFHTRIDRKSAGQKDKEEDNGTTSDE